MLQGLGVTWLSGEGHEKHLAIVVSVATTTAAVLALAWLERRGRGASEARVGVLYSLASALAMDYPCFSVYLLDDSTKAESRAAASRLAEQFGITLVTRTNRAPTVTNPGAQSSAEGAAVALTIQASDPDGNTLRFLNAAPVA